MLIRKEKNETVFMYRTIYIIVHYLYSFVEYINDAWFKIKQTVTRFYLRTVGLESSLVYVYSEAQKLEKLPNHLTVLLAHENHSLKDLSNFILWSLAAGVPFISFYDGKGALKRKENELHAIVEKTLGKNYSVIWHNSLHVHKNGVTGRKIHAKVYTQENGRDSVVHLAKRLSLSTKVEDINIQYMDNCLRKDYEFPDPDLGIYCGKMFSLFGCPPWQVRVTEFLNIRSHHNVSVYSFIELLKRYNKCEQRLGK